MTVALVTGIAGQDGFYLATFLHSLGIDVVGMSRSGIMPPDLPFVHPAAPADFSDETAVRQTISAVAPDEIYHLAAQSSVSASWESPIATVDVTGVGVIRLLEAVRKEVPRARVFIASSSEIFGKPDCQPQDEATPLRPISPYGAAKAYAHHMARIYRQRYGLYIAVGILYNHESPRRPPSFVTRKITQAAAKIARGEQSKLILGNLDARRDWGYAGDYVQAMYMMLQQHEPDDFVIATGITHTVRDWCALAFAYVGLDYRQYVTSNQRFWRTIEAVNMVGNSNHARTKLGWHPTVGFAELIRTMMMYDIGDPSVSGGFPLESI